MKPLILTILIATILSCTWDEVQPTPLPETYDIWNGPTMEFNKEAGADPDQAINQDKISENVSITRSNEGGEIYNAVSESEAEKGISPLGTKWAIGDIPEISSLNFESFRVAVGQPKKVVGKKLVLYLVEVNAYLSVEFKSWSSQKSGGFSYTRSTKE